MMEIFSAVYLILLQNGKLPLLMRENCGFMDGYWSLIAGRQEAGESLLSAMIREAKEESGLLIARADLKLVHTCNRVQEYENSKSKCWIDTYFLAENTEHTPVNAEPEKHSRIEFFEFKALPANLLPYQLHALNKYSNGKTYSEYGF